MRSTFALLITSAAVFLSFSVSAQNKVSPDQAARHYGETITICGTILEDNFIFDAKTKNTFLVLSNGVKNEKVTVVVPAAAKKVIDNPKNYYTNKNVCVTGKVVAQNGRPEIVVLNQDKIQFGGGGAEIKPNDFMRFE